jgi:hypothetical protein
LIYSYFSYSSSISLSSFEIALSKTERNKLSRIKCPNVKKNTNNKESQILSSAVIVWCIISFQRSPVNNINKVTNDYDVVIHPYLDIFPFSSCNSLLQIFFIKRDEINKYKNIKSPRFKIGLIDEAKVRTIFLNLSHY